MDNHKAPTISPLMSPDSENRYTPCNYVAERLQRMGIYPETEDLSSNDEEEDVALELEEFSDDDNSECSLTLDDGENFLNSNNGDNNDEVGTETTSHAMDLVPIDADADDDDDGEDVDSEEERDIMKEIRYEIENQVKKEMVDELTMYKKMTAAIEQGVVPGDDARRERKNMEAEMLTEPIRKEAMLDKILRKKMKKEKEVKRDRIMLERRIRDEIQNLKPKGRVQNDEKVNTERFVALALPPSHNEGVTVSLEETTPVFQTQLDEDDFLHRKAKTSKQDYIDTGSLNGSSSERSSQSEKKNMLKKDFIRRNKELAANVDETHITMTDDERKRVGELLTDVDSLPDIPEEVDISITGELERFTFPLQPGEGFHGNVDELRSMSHIDGRLHEILPAEEYHALMTPNDSARDPPFSSARHKLFTRVDPRSVGDAEHYGDRSLIQGKAEREMQERLQRIEEELARFNNPNELEISTPSLNENTLQCLIDQCVRSLSRSSYAESVASSLDDDFTPRSEVSSSMVVSVLEHPPEA